MVVPAGAWRGWLLTLACSHFQFAELGEVNAVRSLAGKLRVCDICPADPVTYQAARRHVIRFDQVALPAPPEPLGTQQA